MKLTSRAFSNGGAIPRLYTCQGEEIAPPLEIDDVPKGAKSLVLLMDDPDVPEYLRPDHMWDHWVLFNIPPDTTALGEGAPSCGTLGRNTNGQAAYQGPCPPDREHRYFFKLYALDTLLSLAGGASKAEVEVAMKGHILAQAQLIGRYVKE